MKKKTEHGRTMLELINVWSPFNRIVTELTYRERLYDCCDCDFAGVGKMPHQKEKHCIDHALEGKCRFYNNHKELVDKETERIIK